MKRIILSMAIVFSGIIAVNAQNAVVNPANNPKATTPPQQVNNPKVAQAPQQVAEAKVIDPKGPEITFKMSEIDYGTIEHNADGNREFKFKNTGKKPLIISNCTGSCGCTVPSWDKEPVMPGKSGTIKVKYATDRVGHFQKTVTVNSNANNDKVVLTIKGDVKPDPTPATPAKVEEQIKH